MIEITNVEEVRKGTLLCTCDVYIVPWDLEFVGVKVFEKGVNRWITMPCKEYTLDSGEKKYVEMINFRKESTKKRFRNQITEVIDKFLSANPDMTPKPLINEDDEIPF